MLNFKTFLLTVIRSAAQRLDFKKSDFKVYCSTYFKFRKIIENDT